MTPAIRILVVDDHPVIREGLITMLKTQADFVVIGEAANGKEALSRASEHQPDVILLDLDMPELDGLQALAKLGDIAPDSRVIVFTAYGPDNRSAQAVRAGIKGYLNKGVPPSDVYRAIRIVHQGGLMLQTVIDSGVLREHDDTPMTEALTEREMEVLGLLAQGKTNKDIAAALFITERTVKFHISSLMGKLNASNRTEVVSIAANMGLIDLSTFK